MKKFLSIFLMTFLFVFALGAFASAKAHAEDGDNSGPRQGFGFIKRDENRSDMGERLENGENMRRGPKFLHGEGIMNRFKGAVSHIEKFIPRIESRIEKMKADGLDTSVAEDHLDLAKADLEDAKEHWQEAKDLWDGFDPDAEDADAAAIKAQIREHLGLMKTEILSTFGHLKESVKALKALLPHDDNDDSDDDNDEDSGS